MLTVIEIVQTLFVCVLIPAYWWYYGPQNFLWFSDIALFLSTVALWLNSSLLASVAAVSVFVFEIAWAIDVLIVLASGKRFLGLSKYMFRSEIPLWIRLISLFHIWLPWLLLWMVLRFGYDRRALVVQTVVWWIVLVASYVVSTPEENINFAYGVGGAQRRIGPWVYLALAMIVVPVGIYLPTHFFLRWISAVHRLQGA